MRRRAMAAFGIVVTLVMMMLLVLSLTAYLDDPGDTSIMAGMSVLSGGLLFFLVIFAAVYNRDMVSDSERYMEVYQGICSRCGGTFGDDGVCPGCGRHRPSRSGRR